MKHHILSKDDRRKFIPEIDSDGVFSEGEEHAVDGWEYRGSWCFLNSFGKRHRLDGPAHYNGVTGKHYWYINGTLMGMIFRMWMEETGIDFVNPTENDKILIQLKWG